MGGGGHHGGGGGGGHHGGGGFPSFGWGWGPGWGVPYYPDVEYYVVEDESDTPVSTPPKPVQQIATGSMGDIQVDGMTLALYAVGGYFLYKYLFKKRRK